MSGAAHYGTRKELRVKALGADRYTLVDAAGRRHGGVYDSTAQATEAREAMERRTRAPAARTRPCMCCRQPFESEGIHNRLCTECRRQSSEHDSWGPTPGRAHHGKR